MQVQIEHFFHIGKQCRCRCGKDYLSARSKGVEVVVVDVLELL
jgi:hypothetical protein